MNYLHDFLNFTTVEEGEKNLKKALKKAYSIRDGALYWNIANDDCKKIAQKLKDLKRKEQK